MLIVKGWFDGKSKLQTIELPGVNWVYVDYHDTIMLSEDKKKTYIATIHLHEDAGFLTAFFYVQKFYDLRPAAPVAAETKQEVKPVLNKTKPKAKPRESKKK